MRLMVTGAGGFLGSTVVRAAANDGHEIVAVLRNPAGSQSAGLNIKGVRVRVVDLADRAGVAALLAEERPDAVVHAAWSGLASAERASPTQVERNLLPTLHLVERAADAGVARFVGIGSQDEYGPLNHRVTEEDLPAPVSFYGGTKLAAGQLGAIAAAAAGMSFAWLRLFASYGPGDGPDWLIPSLARQLLAGEVPAMTAGTQLWDYLYIDDAARAVVAAVVTQSAKGTFNLSSGQAIPIRTVAETLRDLAAPGLRLRFGEVPFGPHQVLRMEGDNRRLCEATGWRPAVTLAEGLARTVAALRSSVSGSPSLARA